MNITIRAYKEEDVAALASIWNGVVEAGLYFPQTEPMEPAEAEDFFAAQSFTGVAENERGEVIGLYILHPNNIGRCAHIANASYAVSKAYQNRGCGRLLVEHSLNQAKTLGFKLMQFNAVLANNINARHLYEKLGFSEIGKVPGGFLLPDNTYQDIVLYYRVL